MPDSRTEALRLAVGLFVTDSRFVAPRPPTPEEAVEAAGRFNAFLAGETPKPDVSAAPSAPAVPVGESITPDHIVCLDDGERLQVLSRHIRKLGYASPAEYRNRWGLPSDYPMVAPNYAKKRSQIARNLGLGKR